MNTVCTINGENKSLSDLVLENLQQQARIEELEEQLKESQGTAWHNFYITQEVFNYLLTRRAVSEHLSDEDTTWEAAAQNIIKAIENLEQMK